MNSVLSVAIVILFVAASPPLSFMIISLPSTQSAVLRVIVKAPGADEANKIWSDAAVE